MYNVGNVGNVARSLQPADVRNAGELRQDSPALRLDGSGRDSNEPPAMSDAQRWVQQTGNDLSGAARTLEGGVEHRTTSRYR